MPNFFTDNPDILFHFQHYDLARLAQLYEQDFRFHQEFDYAPENAQDAVENYRLILESLGQLAAEVIAPTAADNDRIGCQLHPDGSVSYPPGIAQALHRLAQADLMGFTLPYRFGGLNCPQLLYTMSIEIVSRADAALMNLYGLQGIAETINAYADESIKQQYLPDMAAGRKTGAMVLTEPDAGSDLQSIKTRAYQDASGNWYIQGVKRFITNGCGDVLLVLARSEEGTTDARGLSLFLVERGPRVKIRRLEEKLGIHGSPTCELFFDDAPAKLIGERQRGLVTYVMNLMNGARIGIAAQSLGIAEAAYRVARDFARKRRQFSTAIENLPAVREMLVDMSLDLQAARALTYYASWCVDLEITAHWLLESGRVSDDQARQLKQDSRRLKRVNGLLTPMSKYYASEMSMRVANAAVSVLGGSGYMKDYPVERHLRDSRITTIYEGTSQLQIVAAVRGVVSGAAAAVVEELLADPALAQHDPLTPLAAQIRQGLDLLNQTVAFVKQQPGTQYMDLSGRRLTDMACILVIGSLFLRDALHSHAKLAAARRWLTLKMPELRMLAEQVSSGDHSVFNDFDLLAPPLSSTD